MVDVVRDAAIEVRKPTMFGELIIMIVYLPILTLEGTEGQLFRPMALTVIFALMGSMVLSLTLMPVLASLLLPRHDRRARATDDAARSSHLRSDAAILRCGSKNSSSGSPCGRVVRRLRDHCAESWARSSCRGSPKARLRSASSASPEPTSTIRSSTTPRWSSAVLEEFPDEVEHVWSRIGSAEIATDPMGTELTDMFITLKPREQWIKAHTQADLTDRSSKSIYAICPASGSSFCSQSKCG